VAEVVVASDAAPGTKSCNRLLLKQLFVGRVKSSDVVVGNDLLFSWISLSLWLVCCTLIGVSSTTCCSICCGGVGGSMLGAASVVDAAPSKEQEDEL